MVKSILGVLIGAFFILGSMAGFSPALSETGPKIVAVELMHDVGTVNEDSKLQYDFEIRNEGDQVLIIDKVPTS